MFTVFQMLRAATEGLRVRCVRREVKPGSQRQALRWAIHDGNQEENADNQLVGTGAWYGKFKGTKIRSVSASENGQSPLHKETIDIRKRKKINTIFELN